jgi:hypothetical protein
VQNINLHIDREFQQAKMDFSVDGRARQMSMFIFSETESIVAKQTLSLILQREVDGPASRTNHQDPNCMSASDLGSECLVPAATRGTDVIFDLRRPTSSTGSTAK